MYWWWQDRAFGPGAPFDGAAAEEDLHAFNDAGFGKPHIEHWGADYADAAQRDHLESVAPMYAGYRLQLEQTLGLGFPWTTPATTPERKRSQQTLMYGRVSLEGPKTVTRPVPKVIGGGELVAVTAGKVLSRRPVDSAGTVSRAPPTILDPRSLIEISNKQSRGTVRWHVPRGRWIMFAFWSQNPGALLPFAGSGGKVSVTSGDSTRAGAAYVAEQQVGSAAHSLRGVGSSFYEESQEDGVSGLYWNNTVHDKTLVEFARRRGYQLTRYLPLLFVQGKYGLHVGVRDARPDFDLPGGMGGRYRHDFDETLTDLYIDKHLLVLQRWAKSRFDQRLDSQAAYGVAFDVIRANRALTAAGGLPDTETWSAGDPYQTKDRRAWRFAMDFYRQAASGAAQGGGLEVSLELGDRVNDELRERLADLKYTVDKGWAAGLTRPELAGVTLQPPWAPWPGVSRWNGVGATARLGIAESWNHRTFPEWSHLRPLADYWARGALVLEQGAARTDVAFLRDNFTPLAPPLSMPTARHPRLAINDSRHLEKAGYTIGYLDPVGLREQPSGHAGELFPKGPAYRALIVDPRQNSVDGRGLASDTAVALDKASDKGLAIVFVGKPPSRGTGGKRPRAEDRQVRAAIARISKRPTTRIVASLNDVARALRAVGVRPAAEWPARLADHPRGPAGAGVYSQLRVRRGCRYFYLWNSGTRPVRYSGTFAADGTPYQMNLWSGRIAPIGLYHTAGHRTRVPIDLGPGETTVLAFAAANGPRPLHAVSATADRLVRTAAGALQLQDDDGGRQRVKLSDGASKTIKLRVVTDAPITVGAPGTADPWQLHVESWGPDGKLGKSTRALTDGLKPWTDLPGLANTSGIGTYTDEFKIPPRWIARDRGTRLNLGDIAGGSGQIYINGRLATADVTPKYGVQTDITGLLRRGTNEIKVIFASTLFNRARVEPSVTQARPDFKYTTEAHPTPQMYGLLGPVRLTPYAQQGLNR